MSIGNALLVTGILLDILEAATQISALIQRAQTEGRDITDDEMALLKSQRDDAWKRFDEAGN